MAEMVVASEARTAAFTLKAERPEHLAAFIETWQAVLAGFYR